MKTQVAAREIPFHLNDLPAVRTENHRRFGMWIFLFSFPFAATAIAGVLFTWNIGDVIFPIAASLFALIPLALLAWGLDCFFTTITTTVTSTHVQQSERSPIKNREWLERLADYQLQLKILTLRKSNPSENASTIISDNDVPRFEAGGHRTQTFHIRLKHSNDLRSVELYETKSADKLLSQFEQYRQALSIQVDEEVRDFNTDVPICTLASLGHSTVPSPYESA